MLKELNLHRRNLEHFGCREVAAEVAADEIAGVFGNDCIAVEVGVIEYIFELNSARGYGFEAEDRVVDRAEDTVSHQCERQTARCYVINGEKVVSDRNHKTSGALDQYAVIAFGKYLAATIYKAEIDLATVDPCGKLSRSRVREDNWSCREVEIFGERIYTAETAVQLDILRATDVAGLDEFLGNDTQTLRSHLHGEPSGAIAFARVGVDAGYE